MVELTQMILMPEDERVPLLMEVPVAQDLGPFLVSSSKGYVWIRRRFPNGMVRAAVRKNPVGFMFRDALLEVVHKSLELDWGNVQPLTKVGIQAVLDHLAEYGFDEPVVLYGVGFKKKWVPKEIPTHPVTWVPKGWAVALPANRSYVGTTFDFYDDRLALVLHNPSRGIGIVRPPGE